MSQNDETYLENGREYYSKTDNPVWPQRHRQLPDIRTGLPKKVLREEPFVVGILDTLDRLERETRPGNDLDATGKDDKAFVALNFASWLVGYLVGWAIDHQRGLALKNLTHVPLQPPQTNNHPEYVNSRLRVDSHEHEKAGGHAEQLSNMSPADTRRFVLNVLRPMSWHLHLGNDLADALEALESGETLPILKEVGTSKRTTLTQLKLKLFAVAYIEHHYARGVKKVKSQTLVADKFGVTQNAVRDWPAEVRTALGNLEVDNAIAIAQNAALSFEANLKKKAAGDLFADPSRFDAMFDMPALQRAAQRYRNR
jgi:hypothetical protein